VAAWLSRGPSISWLAARVLLAAFPLFSTGIRWVSSRSYTCAAHAPSIPFPPNHFIPGAPFDGRHLESCGAQSGVAVTCGGNFVIGVGCDQTGGASGGPWVLDRTGSFDPFRNLLNGHNSFRFVCTDPDSVACAALHLELELFGPYLGEAARS